MKNEKRRIKDRRSPMNREMRRQQSGFTLIELLVVIVIIGVLFAVAMPVFENAGRKDTDRAAFNLMNTLRLARQHAISKRQWTLVVFPNTDGGNYADPDLKKCLRGYAVLAAVNNLDGEYRFNAALRDPRASDMQLEFVSDWKYLPEGIYFDDDDGLSGNFVFGASSGGQPTYTANFDFPIAPGNPATRPMGAVLFKPNGRAYVMMDGHATGKYWQDADASKIYLTSAKFYEESGGALSVPTEITGTNTVVEIRNKTGQVHVWSP